MASEFSKKTRFHVNERMNESIAAEISTPRRVAKANKLSSSKSKLIAFYYFVLLSQPVTGSFN